MIVALRFGFLLIAVALLPAWQDVDLPNGSTRVHFASAQYRVGPLQQRLARERGQMIHRPPAETINGYLTKPQGNGPFPAIVHLHGCNGLQRDFRDGTAKHFWSEQLVAWGYVVLAVDSFTTRGLEQICTGGSSATSRIADAVGALSFLATLPIVDANRIALVGFSHGGTTTLGVVGQRDLDLFENEGHREFKAAIAFYPTCVADGTVAVATLVLIGELDDWTPAVLCTAMMKNRSGAGSSIRLIVYPGAHHGFDIVPLRQGRQIFGHWLEYNAAATEQATEEMRKFLAEHLR